MDNRIANDMISSGMIPSGEKTQADLGKTQYGSAPSPSKLMDAYKSMYDKKEEVINEMAGKGMGMTPAPKPQGITPAKRVEKRNLPAKRVEKRNLSTPRPQPKPETEVFQGNVVNAKTGEPLRKASTIEKVRSGRKEVEDKKGITARREKVQGIMNKYGESVDLLAAYRSIYEHHKKDADGNTIPHEDEEVNEGKIPAGLQAYLDKKKGKKEDKKDDKEMKESVEEKVIKIKKDLGESADLFDIISTYFIEEGYDKKDVYAAMSSVDLTEEVQDLHEVIPAILAGAAKVGTMLAKGGAMLGKVGAASSKVGAAASKIGSGAAKITSSGGKVVSGGAPKLGMMGKAKKLVKDNPMTSYMVARDMTSGGGGGQQPMMSKKTSTISASADLFDTVKGQLIDEGLSEEEIKDIMLTLTPDEIMNEMAVNPNIAAMDAKNKADMIARAKAKEVPQNIRDASKRQMKAGTPREDPKNPYTTQDKKDIINYNKNK